MAFITEAKTKDISFMVKAKYKAKTKDMSFMVKAKSKAKTKDNKLYGQSQVQCQGLPFLAAYVQIEYDGVKEYKSHSGIDTKFIFPKAPPKIVATDERRLFVDGLVPRTVYTFNISAYFTDDTWGPVHQIRVETSIGGEFYYRFYCFHSILHIAQ